MSASDDSFARLRSAIDELAGHEAADVLAEARVEARSRVRSVLSEALADAMLEHLHGELDATPERVRQQPPEPQAGLLAWYLHGVVAADSISAANAPADLDGIERAECVTAAGLTAIASRVALADFNEAQLREHLSNMDWVEATARAHERVLEHLRAITTVIPMRMCTVYRTEGGIRELLEREAGAIKEALGQLAGRTEWAVKVSYDPRLAGDDANDAADATSAATGAGYMESRRKDRDREEQYAGLLEDVCVEIDERLRLVAADSVVLPPQRPEVSGQPGTMLLNGAYLVEDDEVERFHDEVRALQERFRPLGLELVPTGPWPAYNFVPGTIGAAW